LLFYFNCNHDLTDAAAAAGKCRQYPCDAQPCYNNATCRHLRATPTAARFQCLCQPGFSGN